MTAPPRLVRRLLMLLLPEDAREPVIGDLDEIFTRQIGHGVAGRRAALTYCRLALRSLLDATGRETGAGTAPSGDPAMMSITDDARYALRLLGRSPGFTLSALVTIALGIGVATAVVSLADVLLFRPLPYETPARLVFLLGWDTARDEMRFSVPHESLDAFAQVPFFEQVAAYQYDSLALSGDGLPERVQGYHVSANTFDMLGVSASLGRAFSAGDAPPGTPVAVISDGLWRRAFGADASVIGRQVRLDERPYTIVAVMPPTFEFPVYNFKGEVWLPFDSPAPTGSVVAVGRLAPGRTIAEAQGALDGVAAALAAEQPDRYRNRGVRVLPMHELGAKEVRAAVGGLLIAVGLLLLLACANLAELLLARGVARQQELATRLALGAGRGRLVRQLLTESLVVTGLGAVLGIIAAGWLLDVLRRSLPEAVTSTLPGVWALGLTGRTLLTAAGVTLAAGLLAGLVPAWRGSRGAFASGLTGGGRRAGTSRSESRLRGALIAVEVALSLALVTTAAFVLQGVSRTLAVDPGFRPDGLMTFAVSLPDTRYGDAAARAAFVDRTLEQLRALPGVTGAGAVNTLPFSTYNDGTRIRVDGGDAAPESGDDRMSDLRTASDGYFEAMGITALDGRVFGPADRATGEPVAIVNRTFARRFLDARPATGRRLQLGDDPVWRRIVGTVDDVHHEQLDLPPNPEVYIPLSQAPPTLVMFAVRASGDAAALAFPVRRAVAEVDPATPAFHVRPMTDAVASSAAVAIAVLSLMAGFAALAAILAAFGVHAVVAEIVNQARSELAVRVALGATPVDLARHILGSAAWPVGIGLTAGIASARGLAHLLGSVVQGVDIPGAAALGWTVAAMTALVLLSAAGPLWRAAHGNTAEVLKAGE